MVYLITYDLNSPGQKYDDLISEIQGCSTGAWLSEWKSSYLIQSNLHSNDVLNKLKQHLDNNDALIVVEVTGNYAGVMTEEGAKYIKSMM